MRRFALIGLILILVVALAGSVTSNVIMFVSYRDEQAKVRERLDSRAARVAELEEELDDAQSQLQETERQLGDSERQISALEEANQSLQHDLAERDAQISALQAGLAELSTPSAAPSQPAVFVTAPIAGQEFLEGDAVVVRWNSFDRAGVARARLEVDGQLVAEMEAGELASAEGEFGWTAAGIGEHRLVVTAVNTAGVESEPAGVTVNVIEPQSPAGAENAAIVNAIEPAVIELRGLEPIRPVTRTLFTQSDLEEYVVEELYEEFPPEEAQADALEMAAFDLVPPDIDLLELMEAVYTEQIAGFYDTDTKSFAVISEDEVMGALEKTIYAHEFTHALQDQHYDLEALDPDENSDDESLAVTALVEGDATLLMQQYMLGYLEPEELFDLLSESLEVPTEVIDNAPPIIRAQLMFPYEAGYVFVQTLHQEGGYSLVDSAYLSPPQSTEQILHPEKYLAGEAPQVVSLPPLTETLGSGWQFVDDNVLGEFTLRVYLEQQVSDDEAAAAAEGWGGDRYAVYHSQETGGLVMVLRVVWDTADEAAEFMSEYLAFGEARFGSPPEGKKAEPCWSGEDAICAYRAGTETLIIRAPDLETIADLEALFPND